MTSCSRTGAPRAPAVEAVRHSPASSRSSPSSRWRPFARPRPGDLRRLAAVGDRPLRAGPVRRRPRRRLALPRRRRAPRRARAGLRRHRPRRAGAGPRIGGPCRHAAAPRRRPGVPAGALRRPALRTTAGGGEAGAPGAGGQLGLEVGGEPARGAGDGRRRHGRGDPPPRLRRRRGRPPRPARVRLLEAGGRLLLEHLPARLPLARDEPHAHPDRRCRGQRPGVGHGLDHPADRAQQHRQDRGGLRPGLDDVRRERVRRGRQHHHEGPEGARRRGPAARRSTRAGRSTSPATGRSTRRWPGRAPAGTSAGR